LSLIQIQEGQAWIINKIGNKYIIGHNEGTYIYKDAIFSKKTISMEVGTW
jgi:hypothetical protein